MKMVLIIKENKKGTINYDYWKDLQIEREKYVREKMKLLLSIQPGYVDKILSGQKKYEYRRKIWRQNVQEVLVYSTAPVQKITMSFKVKNIIAAPPQLLWDRYHEYSGSSKDKFIKYFKNCDTGYAIEIGMIRELPPGILLGRPPQSYGYIHDP